MDREGGATQEQPLQQGEPGEEAVGHFVKRRAQVIETSIQDSELLLKSCLSFPAVPSPAARLRCSPPPAPPRLRPRPPPPLEWWTAASPQSAPTGTPGITTSTGAEGGCSSPPPHRPSLPRRKTAKMRRRSIEISAERYVKMRGQGGGPRAIRLNSDTASLSLQFRTGRDSVEEKNAARERNKRTFFSGTERNAQYTYAVNDACGAVLLRDAFQLLKTPKKWQVGLHPLRTCV